MASFSRALALALCAASAGYLVPAHAQDAPARKPGVTVYPAEYFAHSQPNNALDMVKLLPGFRLQEGDSDLRGYAGAAANVIVDGQRPGSKQESIEALLKRIPAASVSRIELIESAQAGFDMQGYAMIANVVRKGDAALRGRVEGEYARFAHGLDAPRIAGEVAYRGGDRIAELSAAIYREIDDEHGFGSRNRYAADGSLLRLDRYDQPEGESVRQVAGNYGQPLLGGKVRLTGLFKDRRKFADISSLVTYPRTAAAFGTEREHQRASEGSVQFERKLSAATGIELVAIRRDTHSRGIDRSIEGADEEVSAETSDASETIVRAVLRTAAAGVTLETGIEGARNILDSRTSLSENGASIPLPAANVRVAEDRAEGFVTASWRLAARLNLDAGLRGEISRLTQSGDSELTRSLAFVKPRLLATWSAPGPNLFRLLVEREVGQLDFGDFVSSASLNTGTVTAGNKDLEPDRLWRFEIAWERRLGKGSLVLTARHERISDVVDRIPVLAGATLFDAVGNIGSGVRNELQADLTLPLDPIGLRGITVQAHTIARDSRVTDPTTGERRVISEDLPFEGTIALTHDLPRWHIRWGVNYAFATHERKFKIDELESDRLGERIDAFVEYKPDARWSFRLFAKNLSDSAAVRDRYRYAGLRGSSALRYQEQRVMRSGPYLGAVIQRSFGR